MTTPDSKPRTLGEIERERRLLLAEGIGLANFFAFFLISMAIGGFAPGKVTDTAFYLSDHSRFTEVSVVVYVYSWVHLLSQLVTFPLAAYGMMRRSFRQFPRK